MQSNPGQPETETQPVPFPGKMTPRKKIKYSHHQSCKQKLATIRNEKKHCLLLNVQLFSIL
jgi:hypothetical protein